jgi:hypothetical protein
VSAWQIALVAYCAGCVLAIWLLARVFSLVSRSDEAEHELLPRLRRKRERKREDELVPH